MAAAASAPGPPPAGDDVERLESADVAKVLEEGRVIGIVFAHVMRSGVGHGKIDELEAGMLQFPEQLIDLPVTHRFTPGLYSREIFMPKGTFVTSKIHKTEHPLVILSGALGPVHPISAGAEIRAEITGLGSVTARFSGQEDS